jgi:hypothetical protein
MREDPAARPKPATFTPVEPARSGGWSGRRIVTFILALAAGGCVTRAAAATGLSRKSAYALQGRDPAFAALWEQAIAAHRQARVDANSRSRRGRAEGDEVDKVDRPPAPPASGDNWSSRRAWADAHRDGFFAALRQSRPTVPTS